MSEADRFDVLAQAKAHFRAQVADKTATITVPEWGLEFQIKPATLAQRDLQFQRGQKVCLANAAHLVIDRALKGGEPLFNPIELNSFLHQVDSEVLLRISTEIVAYDRQVWGQDDAEPAEDGAAPLSEVELAKKG